MVQTYSGATLSNSAVGDLPDDHQFAYISYLILAIIYALTFLALLYLTVKVIKKVGASDRVIPLMLIFLIISDLCKYLKSIWMSTDNTYTFIIDTIVYLVYWCKRAKYFESQKICNEILLANGNHMFLALAALMNINKWA